MWNTLTFACTICHLLLTHFHKIVVRLFVVLIWWCNNVCRNASGTTLHFYVTYIVSQLILSVQFYIPMVIMLNVWSLYCFIVVWYQLMLFMHPRLTSSALWQSYVCPSASGGTAYWQRPMIHQNLELVISPKIPEQTRVYFKGCNTNFQNTGSWLIDFAVYMIIEYYHICAYFPSTTHPYTLPLLITVYIHHHYSHGSEIYKYIGHMHSHNPHLYWCLLEQGMPRPDSFWSLAVRFDWSQCICCYSHPRGSYLTPGCLKLGKWKHMLTH